MNRLSLCFVLATAAFGQSKFSRDLDKNSNAAQDVIVQFRTMLTSTQLSAYGGIVKHSFGTLPIAALKLPKKVIDLLEKDANVRYVTPDRKMRPSLDVSTGSAAANLAWAYGYTGVGIGVAVIDSGITVKSDLAGRVVYSESWVGGDTSDGYGHGTHVAGIIAGSGAQTTGLGFAHTFKGVSPGVNLINLRVLDNTGAGDESDVIAAINRAIELKNTYNIRVINLSLGRPVYESYLMDPLCQAVEAAWKAGIVVVVAAGNYGRDNTYGTKGYGTIASPGNDPYVITVGATNAKGTTYTADDSIASYSSRGPSRIDHIVKPDLVAPGNAVVSLMASPTCTLAALMPTARINNNYYQTGVSGQSSDYFRLSGTSMATPVVVGAAALLLQKQPSLTPDQVKARLMKTAHKTLPLYMFTASLLSHLSFNNQADVFTVGAGFVDIYAALLNTDIATLPAISPTAIYNPATKSTRFARAFSVTWGDSVIWGDAALYGNLAFKSITSGSSVIWGDSVTWGDEADPGFSVIWGDSLQGLSLIKASSGDDGDQ